MEALKELGRFCAFLVLKTAEIFIWAAGYAVILMVVAIYSLVTFSLGLEVDDKGELSYRR